MCYALFHPKPLTGLTRLTELTPRTSAECYSPFFNLLGCHIQLFVDTLVCLLAGQGGIRFKVLRVLAVGRYPFFHNFLQQFHRRRLLANSVHFSAVSYKTCVRVLRWLRNPPCITQTTLLPSSQVNSMDSGLYYDGYETLCVLRSLCNQMHWRKSWSKGEIPSVTITTQWPWESKVSNPAILLKQAASTISPDTAASSSVSVFACYACLKYSERPLQPSLPSISPPPVLMSQAKQR